MAMTSENYVGLKKRCDNLCLECERIIREHNEGNDAVELDAEKVYDEIVGMERELEISITNIKTESIKREYKIRLKEIQSYVNSIYLIAHII